VTAQPAVALTVIELDALTELVNVGISRAASSLRALVLSEVILSVPAVEIVTFRRAAQLVGELQAGTLAAVHQSFSGEISGGALVIFPETNSLELVRAITGGDLPLEDIIALEQEALAETGNIILNGCLATIANMLRRTLNISLPEVMYGTSSEIFSRTATSVTDSAVLFLYINFSIRNRAIQGYIAMLLDLPSLLALKGLIQELILGASNGPPS
jgi:chemotaxis protein CheC